MKLLKYFIFLQNLKCIKTIFLCDAFNNIKDKNKLKNEHYDL